MVLKPRRFQDLQLEASSAVYAVDVTVSVDVFMYYLLMDDHDYSQITASYNSWPEQACREKSVTDKKPPFISSTMKL